MTPAGLRVLQEFEGTVVSADDDEFVALLRDRTDPDRPEEEATFALDEVPPDDHDLIEPGAIFYWTICYETRPYRRRVSEIRFRRLPRWSESDLKLVEAEAADLYQQFVGQG